MLTQKTSERRKLPGPFLNRDICFIHFIGKRKRIAQNVIIAMPNFIITWSNDAASNITHLMSLPNELSFSNNSNISRKNVLSSNPILRQCCVCCLFTNSIYFNTNN